MKSIKILILAGMTAAISSCASSNDVVNNGLFQKRKYNSGYHISKKTKVDVKQFDAKESLETAKIDHTEKDQSVSLNNTNIDVNTKTVTNEAIVVNQNISSTKEVSTTEATSAKLENDKISLLSLLEKDDTRKKSSNNNAFNNVLKNHSATSGKTESMDDQTLLLVIVAIFIPFLAVGIYEGITNRFWISLILTLLFFLPGMIYALLVVTGTI